MYQTVHVREEPCSKVNPEVTAAMDAILAKALAKSQDERYATMKEFLRALREALKAMPEPQVLPVPEAAPAPPAIGTDVAIDDSDRPRTFSRQFNSLAGTRRLAELTGDEKDESITMFLQRNPASPAPKRPPSATGSMKDLLATRGMAAPAPRTFPVLPAALLGTLGAVVVVLGIALAAL